MGGPTACLFVSVQLLPAQTLVVADFNSGAIPLSIGSGGLLTTVNNITSSFKTHLSSETAVGNRGYSLRINHPDTANAFLLFEFTAADIRGMRGLSFWVRGAAGGESFALTLRSVIVPGQQPSTRPNVKEFMVSGITTDWQKVNIPIKTLFREFLVEHYESLSSIDGIVLNFTSETGSSQIQTLYLDDVMFTSEPGNVMISNFELGISWA